MQINVNSDKTVAVHAGLHDHVRTVVSDSLHRFGEQITSVEVHLSDNLGQKSADGDNRCLMEARITGYKPIAVSDHSATLHQAIGGASAKLKRAIDSAMGRLQDKDKHQSAKDAVPAEDDVEEDIK